MFFGGPEKTAVHGTKELVLPPLQEDSSRSCSGPEGTAARETRPLVVPPLRRGDCLFFSGLMGTATRRATTSATGPWSLATKLFFDGPSRTAFHATMSGAPSRPGKKKGTCNATPQLGLRQQKAVIHMRSVHCAASGRHVFLFPVVEAGMNAVQMELFDGNRRVGCLNEIRSSSSFCYALSRRL